MQLRRHMATLLRKHPNLLTIPYKLVRYNQAHFTLGAVGVITNPKNEILLVEHLFHPQYPWGLPGGWVDKDEAPQQTVIREIHEEVGLNVTIQQMLIFNHHYSHIDFSYWATTHNPDITTLSYELMNYAWVTPDKALTYSLRTFHRQSILQYLDIRGE